MGWTKERFQHEMRKFDPLLRLRLNQSGEFWLVERKASHGSVGLVPPSDKQKRDAFIRNRDGFIHVATVRKDLLGHQVFLNLRAHDAWQFKNGGAFADHLDEIDAMNEAAKDQAQHNRLQDCGAEAYDKLRFLDGGQVSGFHQKA